MTDAETETTAELLREIKGHSVIVVEHDMAFVRALGVKVTVLHEGSDPGRRHARPGSALTRASSRSISGGERMLAVHNVDLFYGAAQALRLVSLTAGPAR